LAKGAAVIVVFGGVQIDQPGSPSSPRFPASQVEDVAGRVHALLSSLKPRLVLGAAASGVDLVILEEVLELGLTPHVALPFPVERFKQTSVESRGPAWVSRYRRVIAEVQKGRGEIEILEEAEDDDVYLRTNGRLLDRGRELAQEGEEVLVLVVRPANSDGGSVSDDLAERAELAGLLVLDLDCLRRAADRPSAFVAMPYGKKKDPQTGVEIDCDLVFDRIYVPVLEDLDYRWERSDRQTDTGIIHLGMIDAIANSDLVIADLATLNANVLYEIGLRHAVADKVTVLTAPDFGAPGETRRLFDLNFIRRIPYRRGMEGLTDAQMVESIRTLRAVLADAGDKRRPPDSPVFTWFECERTGLRARAGTTRAAQREIELRKELAAAKTRGGRQDLLAVAGKLDDSPVPVGVRQSMRLELAIALRETGAYDEAVTLFEAGPAPEGPLRTLWLQQHALALRRRGERQWQQQRDPDDSWSAAERLLDELLDGTTPAAETYGIAAGLAKRRFERYLSKGQHPLAGGQLARMIEQYRTGFEAEPWDYYVGINLLGGLRLRGQRFRDSVEQDLAEARDLVPVVRLMIRRLPPGGRNFWVDVTEAELALHTYLLDDPDGRRPADAAIQAYANALAGSHPADHQKSARDQLEIFRKAGDPPHVIDAVLAAFPPSPST
jgi:tetratricopeptide (TPR) repeat protein